MNSGMKPLRRPHASILASEIFRYGTVIEVGLAISKNLSLESADIQAFVMERVPIVSDF